MRKPCSPKAVVPGGALPRDAGLVSRVDTDDKSCYGTREDDARPVEASLLFEFLDGQARDMRDFLKEVRGQ